MEITEGSTNIQKRSAQLTLFNLKPERSQTHRNNFFLISSSQPCPRT